MDQRTASRRAVQLAYSKTALGRFTGKVRRAFRSSNPPSCKSMVAWYDPAQLARTGVKSLLSHVFAERADFRLIEAIGAFKELPSYRNRSSLWFDYAADVGDGFNTTFAVARELTRSELEPGEEYGPLRRGSFLVLGGDQVYPTADEDEYRERLVHPYEAAWYGEKGETDLYALPGNHDWYDGLASFMQFFCTGLEYGGFKTRQNRSYFALELPHRWWLLGLDVQLRSDLDTPQVKYFESLPFQENDRIILCTAEPHWIYGNVYAKRKKTKLGEFLDRLEATKKVEVVLQIAGDLHHYRRHTLIDETGKDAKRQEHLVTAGGGGAFLHPTHTHRVEHITIGEKDDRKFECKVEYPTRSSSRSMGLLNIFFPLFNPRFGFVTAFAYMMLSLVMPMPQVGPNVLEHLDQLFIEAARELADQPSGIALSLAILGCFIGFTDTNNKAYRWIAGPLHGLLHLAAALVIAAEVNEVVGDGSAMCTGLWDRTSLLCELSPLLRRIALSAGTAAGGYLFGSLAMGIYLLISVCVFNRHYNEAFSSLRIEGYRNFLRMHVGEDGALTVYALGMDRVPGRWEQAGGGYEPGWEQDFSRPRVIDRLRVLP